MNFVQDTIVPLAPAIGLILAPATALFLFWLGRRAYFRQSEFEMVRARYLDDGLDEVVSRADYTLQIFRNNWAHSLNALKNIRTIGGLYDVEEYFEILITPDAKALSLASDRKVKDLIGSNAFFESMQYLAAFSHNSYVAMRNDLGGAIKLYVDKVRKTGNTQDKDEIVDTYLNMLKQQDQEANTYYVLTSKIQEVAYLFQKERFSFTSLEKFRSRSDIKSLIRDVENILQALKEVGEEHEEPNNGFNPDAGKARAG